MPAGKVTIRQVAALYVYENYLYAVEMNGARLRAALEHAAKVFVPALASCFRAIASASRFFNADSAAGVDYTIDLGQPIGHRITNLRYKGKPLDDAQKLRVAVNNYQYSGGGGYGFKGLPIVYRSARKKFAISSSSISRGPASFPALQITTGTGVEPQEAVEALRRAAMEQENRAASSR